MFTLDNTDVSIRDLDFFVDFEMTPLLDMTIEIAPTHPKTPRSPKHVWLHRNLDTTRVNGCSFRNAGRKSRTTK